MRKRKIIDWKVTGFRCSKELKKKIREEAKKKKIGEGELIRIILEGELNEN